MPEGTHRNRRRKDREKIVSAAFVLLCGCAGLVDPSETTLPPSLPLEIPADQGGFRSLPVACGASLPPLPAARRYLGPPPERINPNRTYRVVITTSCGELTIELDPARAPLGVNSVLFLVEQGFYAGSPFLTLEPGLLTRFGDPTGTGSGGPGYAVPAELPPDAGIYTTGAVLLAADGEAPLGSQLILVLGEQAPLQIAATHPFLGRVVAGEETLDALNAIRVDESGTPEQAAWVEQMQRP